MFLHSFFLEPEETDIKFKAEDIYNNRFLPDEDDSDVDEDDESSPFERMMKKMEDISPDKNGMVFKKVLQQGSGAIVPEGAIVRSMSNNYRIKRLNFFVPHHESMSQLLFKSTIFLL